MSATELNIFNKCDINLMNKKCVYLRPCTKALNQQKSLRTYLTRPFIPITLIAPLQLSLFLCHIKRIYIHNVFPYFLFIFSRMRPIFINNFLFKHNTKYAWRIKENYLIIKHNGEFTKVRIHT